MFGYCMLMRHEMQIAFLRTTKLYFFSKTLKITGVKYWTIFSIHIVFWFNLGAVKMRPFPNKFVKSRCSILILISFYFSVTYCDDRVTVVIIFDKTRWSNNAIDPHFLDLGTSWRWVVSFTAWPLYSGERAPGTHLIGGWMDPRAGLDDVENRKFLILSGLELRPLGRPVRSQSLYLLRYPGSWCSFVTDINQLLWSWTYCIYHTLYCYELFFLMSC
jgi:hypothetical protein